MIYTVQSAVTKITECNEKSLNELSVTATNCN